MDYMLIFNETEDDFAKRASPTEAEGYWAAWMSFIGEIQSAGIFVSGAGLQPAHMATTLRLRDGQRIVQDGPFADTKEMLGGFLVITVPDLDTAIEWAAKAPCAPVGSVEVRPVLPPMGAPEA